MPVRYLIILTPIIASMTICAFGFANKKHSTVIADHMSKCCDEERKKNDPISSPDFRDLEYGMKKWLDSKKECNNHCKDIIIKGLRGSKTIDSFNDFTAILLKRRKITPEFAEELNLLLLKLIQSPSFEIKLNQRAGSEKGISIPIAKCHGLSLSQENLGEIFRLANEYTVNTQYAIQNTSVKIDNRMVHRPNHNGTHSIRQVRYVEALFDLIATEGKEEVKEIFAQLTDQEKINIKLAAFFLRAGRVDESSHYDLQPDDYYTRSAMIYRAYAKQFGLDQEMIEWTQRLIIDSCKPIYLCQEATKNEKSRFVYNVFTTVHELDLVRCFNAKSIIRNVEGTKDRLPELLEKPCNAHVTKLYQFSRDVCAATGARRCVDNYLGNGKLFADCSLDGNLCLEAVRKVEFPLW